MMEELYNFVERIEDQCHFVERFCCEGLQAARPRTLNKRRQSPPLHTSLQDMKMLLCSGMVMLLYVTGSEDLVK